MSKYFDEIDDIPAAAKPGSIPQRFVCASTPPIPGQGTSRTKGQFATWLIAAIVKDANPR